MSTKILALLAVSTLPLAAGCVLDAGSEEIPELSTAPGLSPARMSMNGSSVNGSSVNGSSVNGIQPPASTAAASAG